jgi:4-hydroxy 2-oxovalerate aldolase
MPVPDNAPWITYRPEIKVLDCTLRDGGLVTDSHFSDDFAKALYDACLEAGIDMMEVGYRNSPDAFPEPKYGKWRHSREEELRRVFGDHDAARTGLTLSAMVDAGGKSDWRKHDVPASESVLGLMRVACYVHQISEAVEMVHHYHELGYETTINIMAISIVGSAELAQALEVAARTPTGTLVVVDSFGNLYREQVDQLVQLYQAAAGDGRHVGIHAHNNLQLAFANTIEAIILGCNRADASMMGLGRGAGNCPMELLLGWLRNPKFKLRPVLKFIQEQMLPLRARYDWGPSAPYYITGLYNQHPRAAIAMREGPAPDEYVEFYDSTTAEL